MGNLNRQVLKNAKMFSSPGDSISKLTQSGSAPSDLSPLVSSTLNLL